MSSLLGHLASLRDLFRPQDLRQRVMSLDSSFLRDRGVDLWTLVALASSFF